MAQSGSGSSGFDMSKLTTGDKIVLGAAGVFIIWAFIPVWYSCCSIAGFTANLAGVSGFRGLIIISWLLAVLAIAEIVITRLAGTNLNLPAARGMIHIGAAGLALLFTLLGLLTKPTGTTLSWGIFVGVILALIWTYGAYMLYQQPAETGPPPSASGSDMGGGGGFTS